MLSSRNPQFLTPKVNSVNVILFFRYSHSFESLESQQRTYENRNSIRRLCQHIDMFSMYLFFSLIHVQTQMARI